MKSLPVRDFFVSLNMKNDNRLFLLDAYALIFRSYYAFISRPIINSKGFDTSAAYGFTNTILDLINREKPTHIGVVFDPTTPTFRTELYSDYKANREETPEGIKQAVPHIKALLDAFSIPVIEIDGYEADDIIGTLANLANQHGYTTFMVTPDKDFGQLVSENIFMYKPRRSGGDIEIWGVKEICEKFMIEDPKQVIDILALWGDTSDNIPGVPGIGEKTSKKLISTYKSVENLIAHVDELKGKQKENIINHVDQIHLSKKLATIIVDAPVSFEPDKLIFDNPDKTKLLPLLNELEFNSIKNRLFNVAESSDKNKKNNGIQQSLFEDPEKAKVDKSFVPYNNITDVEHDYKLISTIDELRNLCMLIEKNNSFCFDTETSGLNPFDSDIIGISICMEVHKAYYIHLYNSQDKDDMLKMLKSVFEDENIKKTGQNLKFDIEVLRQVQIYVKGKLFDTMIAHYVLQPELKHNLDYLAETYLGYSPVSIETLIGAKGKGQLNMKEVPLDRLTAYASEDADITLQIAQLLEKEIKQAGLHHLLHDIEMPLIYVLSWMESTGVKLDLQALAKYSGKLSSEIKNIRDEIIQLAGVDFNIASPKQLGEILFDRLKIIDNPKKTKSKQYSTSEETLLTIKDAHPIINKILKYRSLTKLLSTYVDALPKLINKHTNRIHTSFNQAIAATGRLSSNNPNLQNIPIREEEGREIRKSFIADQGNVIFSADYSQIELRLMAHMSNDQAMIEAFNNKEDIHTATASKIYRIPIDEVTKDQRSKAKTANFGIIYGISAFGLAQRLNISRAEAKSLIDGYFQSYPGVSKYMTDSIKRGRDKGFVETIMGRKRYLKDIHSRNAIVRGMAERNAINAPIQGSAADIIKLAMINIFDELINRKLYTKMILQVHDELVFEVPEQELNSTKDLVVNAMQKVIELKVPLVVDSGVGNNWLEAH